MKANTDEQGRLKVEFLEKVEGLAKKVDDAYSDMLRASIALADAVGQNHESIVRKALPDCADERMRSGRVALWFKYEQDSIVARFIQSQLQLAFERKRAALMDRLKLTEEDKKLLGIE
jgi:hypothetical protein